MLHDTVHGICGSPLDIPRRSPNTPLGIYLCALPISPFLCTQHKGRNGKSQYGVPAVHLELVAFAGSDPLTGANPYLY